MDIISATQEWFAQFGTAGWLAASLLTTVLVVVAVIAVGFVLIVIAVLVMLPFQDEVLPYTFSAVVFAVVAAILKNKYF